MYLIPTVAVRQTEWRTCGPSGGYSLQCFNDSDAEVSTIGTPISDKVQMIIESLRSSQSSLEMGDEIEENALPRQDGHPQEFKVAVGAYGIAKTSTRSQQTDFRTTIKRESSDCDSDDSVDRGIEEAIAMYLKEKGDHKRKAEAGSMLLQPTKIPRNNDPILEVSKQNSDNGALLIASNTHPQSETTPAPAAIPIKKYIKNKVSLSDSVKSTITPISAFPKEQTKNKVNVDDDSTDSSSDDGIEEAIQRYQLEKLEQQNRSEPFDLHSVEQESDSTSDDGIEEAIRCYQLEQHREKSVPKPFTNKINPNTKSVIHAVGSKSMESIKKCKLRKKKTRTERDVKSRPLSSAFVNSDLLLESQKGTGNGLFSCKGESFQDQLSPTPPKVNTSAAELMCAEAILDISKTVMPEVFQHGVELTTCAQAESIVQSSIPHTSPDEDSDDSSIDSEDGIEQEIRKFLEQKAQMNKQPSTSAATQEPQSAGETEKVKAKQKKPSKMSLTRSGKIKEEILNSCNMTGVNSDEVAAPKSLPDHKKTLILSGKPQTEQSGDKSSSLDSDEDLDTAIKDLLKTKKKSKKKIKDSKRKSKKCLRDEEPLLGNTLQTKRLKPDPVSKPNALKKMQKMKGDVKNKTESSEKSLFQHKQSDNSKEHDDDDVHRGVTEILKWTESQDSGVLKEDSSSVDSDDSIEQEIQRFLAEKAKVSTVDASKNEELTRNGSAVFQDEGIKVESQLAEIPISGPSLNSSLPPSQSLVSDISVQSCSPSLLEPADGAGAARTEQRKSSFGGGDVQNFTPQAAKLRSESSASTAHSRSESIKWRQSFGLPISDTRTGSRIPFHITSSKVGETASPALPCQSRAVQLNSQTPFPAWSSMRTSGMPLSWSTQKNAHTLHRSPAMKLLSFPKQQSRLSFSRSMSSGHRSPCPVEGETESMVHISKDKSVFVELESDRTNHVQVRSRERGEGKERAVAISEIKKEEEHMSVDDKEVHLDRDEEEFVDEAECESDSRGNPEKKQGFSTLSLSREIDPGFIVRPCVALTTEERGQMFKRCLPEEYKKEKAAVSLPGLRVKRKLQFVSVNR